MEKQKGSAATVVIIIFIILVLLAGLIIYHRRTTGKSSFGSSNKSQSSVPNSNTSSGASLVKNISVLVDKNGGRVDWSWTNDLITYSVFSQPGNYGGEIYTMNPDGSNKICLTCNVSQIAHLSNDQPVWHPNGNYILFQSIDPGLPKPAQISDSEYKHLTQGGFGYDNNLWIVTKDGKNFYQLTHIQKNEASMHAQFSNDGKKLLWSANVIDSPGTRGKWVLRVADFIDDASGPHLGNIKDYSPLGDKVFYEAHDWYPDDNSILFSSSANPDGQTAGCASCILSVWKMDLSTGKATALTDSQNVWNEHSHITQSGQKIDWISSQGSSFSPNNNWAQSLKTDLWMMNADGSNKQQLTFFNTPGNQEDTGARVILADSAWNKTGDKIVVTQAQISGLGVQTKVILVELNQSF